jgi:hypothetical protein
VRTNVVRRAFRALRRERPVHTLKSRLLVAFPWEIGWFRFLWLTRLGTAPPRTFEQIDDGTRELAYSASFLRRYGPDRRVQWTMFLLASIPDCPRDSLLIIGPRYEPELLMAQGLGWDREAVRGLDTFSYSPAIDVGDMHRLPYDDASFGAIVCGWTLSYSATPEVACREMQRVLRPGGYLVIAMQKVPEGYTEGLSGVLRGDERVQTLRQLDAMFPDLERVAGFEPVVFPGGTGHTLAAYRKPAAR